MAIFEDAAAKKASASPGGNARRQSHPSVPRDALERLKAFPREGTKCAIWSYAFEIGLRTTPVAYLPFHV